MRLDERNYQTTTLPKVAPGLEPAREQVDRILASNTLHASDVLRRLLRFLADKTFSGEADELKEYSVGLDALGKPSTYDPRQDAAVRLQASRLRQKLDDYYRNEGASDPLVVELPKGRFKIAWHLRETRERETRDREARDREGRDGDVAATAPALSPPLPAPPGETTLTLQAGLKTWRTLAVGLAALALILAFVSVWSLSRTRPQVKNAESAGSTPELNALWRPFLSSGHHMIIAFINPLFVRLQRKGSPDIVYRTSRNNSWNDVVTAPEFSILKQSLANPLATPTYNLVERSNLISTFVLSQFFAGRRGDISLARADELSWQQFADNDVVLFGPFDIGGGQSALPVRTALVVDKEGVRNLQPRPGEPALYADPPDHSPSDGEALELVSVLPGPLGRTTVITFASNHKWAVIGGVQALVDATFARLVVQKLKGPSGEIPRYYQIVFKIMYRDGTLTNASYVTHRALTMTQSSVEARAEQ